MLETNYTIFRIFKHLSTKCKKGILLNLFFMIGSSFSELLTLNSLLPFLGVLTNDSNLLNYPVSSFLSKLLKTDQTQDLILPIMIFFGVSVINRQNCSSSSCFDADTGQRKIQCMFRFINRLGIIIK